MTDANPPSPAKRRPPPAFQPRFLLSMLYLLGFFVLYCFMLIAPELIEVLNTVPAGPEQEQLAAQVAQEAIRPRLPIALVLALGTLGIGSYYQVLPGLRPLR